MKTDYLPALRTRSASQLLCGHTDCRYYSPLTDSCDYLLIAYEPRGCPPTPDCPRCVPVGRPGLRESEALAARIQAYRDMGWNTPRIARRLRLSVPAVRLLRARRERTGTRKKNP